MPHRRRKFLDIMSRVVAERTSGVRMEPSVFINLPANDLERTRKFYEALGCVLDERFSDENAASLAWPNGVVFMMLKPEFLGTFTTKPIIDPAESVQAMIAFNKDSREDVDAAIEAGVGNGGEEAREPQDLGFMYGRALHDPDGNVIEFVFMDMAAAAEMFADGGGQEA